MRMMVVLPAPLLPRRPTISFFSTSKVTLLTAMIGPKYFVRFWTWIMFEPSCAGRGVEGQRTLFFRAPARVFQGRPEAMIVTRFATERRWLAPSATLA